MASPNLIHDIIIGINQRAKQVDKLTKDALEDEDFSTSISQTISSETGNFQMKDYCPLAFAYIRKLCGISTESYLGSWHLPKDEAKLTESAGRSGSLFFRTDDKQFFFKTILHPEVGTLCSVLKQYINHLTKYPKSFIMRLVGLHRVSYGSNHVWVLVFGNVYPPRVKIDDVYDLKGRKPKPGKSFAERGRKTPENNPLKDNEINRKINFVVPEERQFYLTQLKADVDFLAENNLMDYSLLIGVHRLTDEEKALGNAEANGDSGKDKKKNKKKHKKEKSRKHDKHFEVLGAAGYGKLGGLRGQDTTGADEIYFIGIIDCLTSFVFKKKVAFMFKSVLWDRETLSTVKAKYYGKRFLNFMTNDLLAKPAGENDAAEESESESTEKPKAPKGASKSKDASQSSESESSKGSHSMADYIGIQNKKDKDEANAISSTEEDETSSEEPKKHERSRSESKAVDKAEQKEKGHVRAKSSTKELKESKKDAAAKDSNSSEQKQESKRASKRDVKEDPEIKEEKSKESKKDFKVSTNGKDKSAKKDDVKEESKPNGKEKRSSKKVEASTDSSSD